MSEASGNRKFEDFLQELLHSTHGGKVDWEDSAADETFIVSLKHGSVHIERRYRFDGDDERFTDYAAYLYDRRGRLAAEIVSTQMDDNTLLSLLYEEARRHARKSDSLLDLVTADLQAKGRG